MESVETKEVCALKGIEGTARFHEVRYDSGCDEGRKPTARGICERFWSDSTLDSDSDISEEE